MPKLVAMVDSAKATAAAAAASAAPGSAAQVLKLPGPIPMLDNPNYGALDNMAIAAFVLVVDPAVGALRARFRCQHLGAAGHRRRLRRSPWRWAR